MFKNKTILITGGTGSFGQSFLKYLLKNFTGFKKIIIFSRDELKQFEMSNNFSEKKFPFIRYFLGDVRDLQRLNRAMEDVNYVVHAAALKQVPAAEYNPFEVIKTNVIGAQNIIEACLSSKVKKVIALSSDKAVAPINLYGATKLCSDKLFISANNILGKRDLSFSVVRYGNVMGSRGSVVPFFLQHKDKGFLPITDKRMTRFNIMLDEGVEFVHTCLKKMWGGEIFVPKIPSYNVVDLARAVAPNCKHKFVGIRPGEKIHEEMISTSEAINTIEFKNYFVITPNPEFNYWTKESYMKKNKNGNFCKYNFSYNSQTNSKFLTIKEIKKLINKIIL